LQQPLRLQHFLPKHKGGVPEVKKAKRQKLRKVGKLQQERHKKQNQIIKGVNKLKGLRLQLSEEILGGQPGLLNEVNTTGHQKLISKGQNNHQQGNAQARLESQHRHSEIKVMFIVALLEMENAITRAGLTGELIMTIEKVRNESILTAVSRHEATKEVAGTGPVTIAQKNTITIMARKGIGIIAGRNTGGMTRVGGIIITAIIGTHTNYIKTITIIINIGML
jgi:dsDNA-specific endonuclease/ATPase MutS2